MNRYRLLKLVTSLMLVTIFFSACSAPAATPTPALPTVTPRPPTATPIPPTVTPTPVPPTATLIPTTGTIEGKVFRSDTSKPITGAIVALHDAKLDKDVAETTTDAQGCYSFSEVKPGTYSLAVTWKFKDQSNSPCTGIGFTQDGWLVIVGVQQDGGLLLVATGAEQKFSVAAGEVVQKDVDLKCR